MLRLSVYLLDTNVISEIRKKQKANIGVKKFFKRAIDEDANIYISVITIGELRRGIELIRNRKDTRQANQLEKWLNSVLTDYHDNILEIDEDTAQLWGKLRSPNPENSIDKQIAASAMINGLTVVTRNEKDFIRTGVDILNPFE